MKLYLKYLRRELGKILPLAKFFKFSLHRSGELIPSSNVTQSFLTYAKIFEKKIALDRILPKFDIAAQALTPQNLTPKGLEMDT